MTTPKPREACPSAADGTETASASVLLRRSLEMLDSVGQLLQALSPAEIEAVAERARLGRLVDRDAIYWRLYSDRHRVLSDVFATQRSTFTQAAQACLGRDHRPAAERS